VDADRHVRARWRRLLRANRLDDNLPPAPLRGWDDELATLGGRVPLAVPASLAAATADENDPATPETR